MKLAGADAVRAVLVFSDLLECDPDPMRDILLTHAECKAAHANALADMLVRRIGMACEHQRPPLFDASFCLNPLRALGTWASASALVPKLSCI